MFENLNQKTKVLLSLLILVLLIFTSFVIYGVSTGKIKSFADVISPSSEEQVTLPVLSTEELLQKQVHEAISNGIFSLLSRWNNQEIFNNISETSIFHTNRIPKCIDIIPRLILEEIEQLEEEEEEDTDYIDFISIEDELEDIATEFFGSLDKMDDCLENYSSHFSLIMEIYEAADDSNSINKIIHIRTKGDGYIEISWTDPKTCEKIDKKIDVSGKEGWLVLGSEGPQKEEPEHGKILCRSKINYDFEEENYQYDKEACCEKEPECTDENEKEKCGEGEECTNNFCVPKEEEYEGDEEPDEE